MVLQEMPRKHQCYEKRVLREFFWTLLDGYPPFSLNKRHFKSIYRQNNTEKIRKAMEMLQQRNLQKVKGYHMESNSVCGCVCVWLHQDIDAGDSSNEAGVKGC